MDEDISGLELTVSSKSNGGGGWKNAEGKEISITEDDWYPGILVSISKQPPPANNLNWGDQLLWKVELQGPQYTWKSQEGKTGQLKVRRTTSMATGPKSTLYKYYSKLTGSDPKEGDKISLRKLIGMPVDVMVKINRKVTSEGEKVYYNIEKLKPRGATNIQPTAQPLPTQPPVQEVIQKQVTTPIEQPVENKSSTSANESSNSSKNIFEDIY